MYGVSFFNKEKIALTICCYRKVKNFDKLMPIAACQIKPVYIFILYLIFFF